MTRLKILYVLHNHPSVRPGGSEEYALQLYEAMRRSDQFEPILVAANHQRPCHPGAPFSTAGGDPNQHFVFAEIEHFDFFCMTSQNKSLYTQYFADFLSTHKPDVVHFQHTFLIGYDIVSQTRYMLPKAPIVYTFQEYLAICNRDGQMVRTKSNALCLEESPRRCNECFPDITRQAFFLRKRFIQSHLAHVDLFLAPSHFLLERYVDWGIPRDKIRFEDYGRWPVAGITVDEPERPRTRIGFFGQFTPYKGTDVLLKAMSILKNTNPDVHLWLHAANLDVQPDAFREEFHKLLEQTRDNVTFTGAYSHASLPKLMTEIDWVVVPSLWWENSPLVIQEAFLHGRPVICSGIGGMAEKVTDGVNGLHFTVNDPGSLARTIQTGISTPGLWQRLRSGIPQILTMEQHVANLTNIYGELLDRDAAQVEDPSPLHTES